MRVVRGPWRETGVDPLGPARGVAIGLLLSLALWAVGLSVWAVFVR